MRDKNQNLSILRRILRLLGLSSDATDEIVGRVTDIIETPDSQKVSGGANAYPYKLRDDFLSAAELQFFRVLQQVIAGRAVLLTKVALRDLFYVPLNDPAAHRTYTNKIDRKHVDYVLCDSGTLKPICAIELDDKSHQREDRQARDVLVNAVFRAAGLPLMRVPVQRTYDVAQLKTALSPYLKAAETLPPSTEMNAAVENLFAAVKPISTPAISTRLAPTPPPQATSPTCPRCGSPMVLRTAKESGNQFWGCSMFGKTRCSGRIAVQR